MSIVSNSITETRDIKWLTDEFKQGNLFVDETFQRNYIWLKKDRISLMETVILGYPIPEIYLWEGSTDPNTGQTKYSIIDGQQRIRTIGSFINNDLKLTDSGLEFPGADYRGKVFDELNPAHKSAIWAYKVSIRFIKKAVGRDDIVKAFLRLNKTSTVLNPQELRNAEFHGEFLSASEEVATQEFWSKWKIFSDGEVRRMADIQFMSTLLIFVRSGFEDETTQSAINKMYDMFNEAYPFRDADISAISQTLNLLDIFLMEQGGLLPTLRKKTHLYTVFTLAFSLVGSPGLDAPRIAEKLRYWFRWTDVGDTPAAFEQSVNEYRRLSQEGVQKKTNRMARYTILEQYVTA